MTATVKLSKEFPTPVREESATSRASSPDNWLCIKETSPERRAEQLW